MSVAPYVCDGNDIILQNTEKDRTKIHHEGKSKINHLLYMDDLKLYGKSKNDLGMPIHTVRVFNDYIRVDFGLDECATIRVKRSKTQKRPIILPEQQKNTTNQRRRLQILRNIRS